MTDAEKKAAEAKAKAEQAKKVAAEKAEKAKAVAAEKAKAKDEAAKKKAEEAKAKVEAKEAANAAKEKAKIEAKEAKEKAKAEAKAKREAEKMPIQNDIRRPKSTTACGKIWEVAENISTNLGQPAPIGEVMKVCVAEGLNEATIKTQYARWKQFFGIEGRVAKIKAEEPVKEAEIEAK